MPPYSPEFNPVEECWSKVKSLLRSIGIKTKDFLEEALPTAPRSIPAQDLKGWLTHDSHRTAQQ
ncbi:MAG: hypothetical protein C4331_02420 [Meiothermus sp.]